MSRRYLVYIAISLGMLFPVAAQANTRYYRGVLADQLSVESDHWAVWTWNTASAGEVRRLGLEPDDVANAFAGECQLPDDPTRPVHGRIVGLKSGRWIAFLDLNRDGKFSPEEGAPMMPLPDGSSARAVARFRLLLPSGPYREMPVLVALPSSHLSVPSSEPGTQRVLIGTDTYVEGHAQLPFGPVLMRFSYDVTMPDAPGGPSDVARTREWMDLNFDGRIDTTPGSPEIGGHRSEAPVFHVKDMHVKNLYVQTTQIDFETRTFTLKTVTAKSAPRIAMAVGDRLPDFEFRDFADKKRKLADVKGEYRLLNFWTTWCRPCIEELPALKSIYDRYHQHGFEILAMNGDSDPEKAQSIVSRFDIRWPQAKLDQQMLETRFQITAWPTKVLIDRHGKVVALLRGDKELDETLQRLLQ